MAKHAQADQPERAEGEDVTRGYMDLMYAEFRKLIKVS